MNAKDLGALIADRRKALGLTQDQLASRLGVTRKAVSRWECGRGYPDVETIATLSEVLETDVAQLFGGEPSAATAGLPTSGRDALEASTSVPRVMLAMLAASVMYLGIYWGWLRQVDQASLTVRYTSVRVLIAEPLALLALACLVVRRLRPAAPRMPAGVARCLAALLAALAVLPPLVAIVNRLTGEAMLLEHIQALCLLQKASALVLGALLATASRPLAR